MSFVQPSLTLTHEATLAMMAAAVAKATEMGQPQCIVIADASATVLGELRMTGAKVLSLRSARAKAMTAASTRGPSANVPDHMKLPMAIATDGGIIGLPGGLPIVMGGMVVGGIGIGSGTGEQDVEVARAALDAIGAD